MFLIFFYCFHGPESISNRTMAPIVIEWTSVHAFFMCYQTPVVFVYISSFF